MIAHLSGKIIKKFEDSCIVVTHEIGYEVFMTKKQISVLPKEGEEITLFIFSYIKEEMMVLYGFRTVLEREIFRALNKVTGIGPKLAMTLISEVAIDTLIHSIERDDAATLSSIPGIGQKTAARIILELKGKLVQFLGALDESPRGDTKLYRDLTDALTNLGFHRHRIHETLQKMQLSENINFENALKESLRTLSESGA